MALLCEPLILVISPLLICLFLISFYSNHTLNLIVRTLCVLGMDVQFSRHRHCMQNPKMRQSLGLGVKVDNLFELTSLHMPVSYTSRTMSASRTTSAASTLSPLHLWYICLGHVLKSRLHLLVSHCYLDFT